MGGGDHWMGNWYVSDTPVVTALLWLGVCYRTMPGACYGGDGKPMTDATVQSPRANHGDSV